jgi:hypothetical protein
MGCQEQMVLTVQMGCQEQMVLTVLTVLTERLA